MRFGHCVLSFFGGYPRSYIYLLQLTEKGAEINGYMEKHNIQIRGGPPANEQKSKVPVTCMRLHINIKIYSYNN
jgi:hypothetical protein